MGQYVIITKQTHLCPAQGGKELHCFCARHVRGGGFVWSMVTVWKGRSLRHMPKDWSGISTKHFHFNNSFVFVDEKRLNPRAYAKMNHKAQKFCPEVMSWLQREFTCTYGQILASLMPQIIILNAQIIIYIHKFFIWSSWVIKTLTTGHSSPLPSITWRRTAVFKQ